MAWFMLFPVCAELCYAVLSCPFRCYAACWEDVVVGPVIVNVFNVSEQRYVHLTRTSVLLEYGSTISRVLEEVMFNIFPHLFIMYAELMACSLLSSTFIVNYGRVLGPSVGRSSLNSGCHSGCSLKSLLTWVGHMFMSCL